MAEPQTPEMALLEMLAHLRCARSTLHDLTHHLGYRIEELDRAIRKAENIVSGFRKGQVPS